MVKSRQHGGEAPSGAPQPQALRLSTLRLSSSVQDDAISAHASRRSSSLATPRGAGGNIFGSIIRTSIMEETKKKKKKGFTWNMRFDDTTVEEMYMAETWKNKRRAYATYNAFIIVATYFDWLWGTKLMRSPLTVCAVALMSLTLSFIQKDNPTVIRVYSLYGPACFAAHSCLDSLWECGRGMADPFACQNLQENAQIPAVWLVTPILSLINLYYAPVPFSQGFVSRTILSFATLINILVNVRTSENLGVLFSFVAAYIALGKRLRSLETQDRHYFLEAHLALKSLQRHKELGSTSSREDSAHAKQATLVRNAMRLTFPENPFHDAATEARIEKCKIDLGLTDIQGNIISKGLIPMPQSVHAPRHATFLSSKIRSIKTARYKHFGDPVVVQSVPNLEVLESEDDLKQFVVTVNDASDLAEIPGLTKTLGFCLTPCTFVVEDIADIEPAVTLRDLALELGAEELKLDWCYFKPLGSCLAGTLAIMHRNGVLHRHINSATILLTSQQTCLLPPVSFHHAFPEARKKLWGVRGVWNVAPEAKDDPKAYTEASEVWALCVVAWEMLVGPFSNQVTPFAVPATVPKQIANVIIDGLSAQPDGRPTMEELFDAFNQDDQLRASTVASANVFQRILERLDVSDDLVAGLDRTSAKGTPSEIHPPSVVSILSPTSKVAGATGAPASTATPGADSIQSHAPSTAPHAAPVTQTAGIVSSTAPTTSPARGTHKVKFVEFADD